MNSSTSVMKSEALLKSCMDFCLLFKDANNFNLRVNISDFSFAMNHGYSGRKTGDIVPKTKKKKYKSPSTKRRNDLRLEAFKAKKRTAKGGCSPHQPVAPPP